MVRNILSKAACTILVLLYLLTLTKLKHIMITFWPPDCLSDFSDTYSKYVLTKKKHCIGIFNFPGEHRATQRGLGLGMGKLNSNDVTFEVNPRRKEKKNRTLLFTYEFLSRTRLWTLTHKKSVQWKSNIFSNWDVFLIAESNRWERRQKSFYHIILVGVTQIHSIGIAWLAAWGDQLSETQRTMLRQWPWWKVNFAPFSLSKKEREPVGKRDLVTFRDFWINLSVYTFKKKNSCS